MATIVTTQNTVYGRASFGVEQFEWAGKCTRIDRIVKEKGAMNPVFCQTSDGGLEITGHTNGTPGLVTSAVAFKETTVESLGNRLETCLWDLDRRHHCDSLAMWNAWDYIERVARGRALTIDKGGSTFNEDEEELVENLPWSALARCTIRRVALSIKEWGGELISVSASASQSVSGSASQSPSASASVSESASASASA